MIKRMGIKGVGLLAVAVFAVGVFYVGSAKAIFPPRALRLFRIMQTNSPTDLLPQIIKTTYSDPGRLTKEMNFEKGDKIYVKVEIFDPNTQGENLVITDRVFNFAPDLGTFTGFKFTKSDGSTPDFGSNQDLAHNKIEFSVNVGKGNNIIEYEYKLGD